eukprot:3600937-Rhodomonas_salina.1
MEDDDCYVTHSSHADTHAGCGEGEHDGDHPELATTGREFEDVVYDHFCDEQRGGESITALEAYVGIALQ